jgi:hypothetical protein
MDNAVRAVRRAIAASSALSPRNIEVFAQGSYCTRTCTRGDSDVDVCVVCHDSLHYHNDPGHSEEALGLTSPASYLAPHFRSEVGTALADYFGQSAIRVGQRAFDVHANTYRVDADVVACFEYRYYEPDRTYREGTAVLPATGSFIANYPKQNEANGKSKNDATSRRYRAGVRVLKNLCSEMAENGYASANGVRSYLLECLVWNVPNDGFDRDSRKADMQYILAHLCNETRQDDSCSGWTEVNGNKYLFHPSQRWSRGAANTFLNDAWKYVGF